MPRSESAQFDKNHQKMFFEDRNKLISEGLFSGKKQKSLTSSNNKNLQSYY